MRMRGAHERRIACNTEAPAAHWSGGQPARHQRAHRRCPTRGAHGQRGACQFRAEPARSGRGGAQSTTPWQEKIDSVFVKNFSRQTISPIGPGKTGRTRPIPSRSHRSQLGFSSLQSDPKRSLPIRNRSQPIPQAKQPIPSDPTSHSVDPDAPDLRDQRPKAEWGPLGALLDDKLARDGCCRRRMERRCAVG